MKTWSLFGPSYESWSLFGPSYFANISQNVLGETWSQIGKHGRYSDRVSQKKQKKRHEKVTKSRTPPRVFEVRR